MNAARAARDFREAIVRERFDAIAPVYDRTIAARRATYNAAVDGLVLKSLRPEARPLRVLDVGCGTGTRWSSLKARLPGVTVCGIDPSREMLALARRRGLDDTRACSAGAIDFDDGSFDIVTCLFFVLCYVTPAAARRRAVAEMRRVLRPGGRLFVDAMSRWHLGEGIDFRRSLAKAIADNAASLLDPRLELGDKLYATDHGGRQLRGFQHTFTPRSLTGLLEPAGFDVERRYVIGYDSGRLHARPTRGQLVQVARRLG
jgi:ubiquinone/menaquinone biosynthesis C-methylase UbiE